MNHFAPTLFWTVFLSVLGGIVVWLAAQAEREFFADPNQVSAARAKIEQQTWREPLARAGAAAQLIGSAGIIAALLLFFGVIIASGVPTHATYMVRPDAALAAIVFAVALWLSSVLIALLAMLLCRCRACAGAIFDNGQAPRKTSIGYVRENWRILTGNGRCPRCGAPFP